NLAGQTRPLAFARRRLNKKSEEPSQGPGTAVPTQAPTLVAAATSVMGGSSRQLYISLSVASESPTINVAGQTRQLVVPRRRLNKKSEKPSQGPGTAVPTQLDTQDNWLFLEEDSTKKSEEPSQRPGTAVPTQVPTLVAAATPVTGGSSHQPSIFVFGDNESPTINVAGQTRQLAVPRRRLNKKSEEPSQGPGMAVPTQVPTLVAAATPVIGGSSHQPSISLSAASAEALRLSF
ncbi:hypothetical protein AB205_0150660, partial [Aquarana catesbeiana]